MNITDYAKNILYTQSIDEKVKPITLDYSFQKSEVASIPDFPARPQLIKPTQGRVKFPNKNSLFLDEKKALAFHFFANHELLALEIMAASILMFPTKNEEDYKMKMVIFQTMEDEKKHFRLYRKRMNDHGVDFGDFPCNDFFWKQLKKIKTPSEYFSFVSLTLEAANLDFAKYYQNIFQELGDSESAAILEIVYKDEIQHVAYGRKYLEKWRDDKSLWEYYISNLPTFITPARSKGMVFDYEGRKKAGFQDDFIKKVKDYRDEFRVTDRKIWKR